MSSSTLFKQSECVDRLMNGPSPIGVGNDDGLGK